MSRDKSTEKRLASMLAAVLDEPYDNPEDPGEVRRQQARELLTYWSSSQGALMLAVRELLNLKQGNCVRCAVRPCPVCGQKEVQ